MGVILIGIVGLLAFFVFIGYIVVVWIFLDSSQSGPEPKGPSPSTMSFKPNHDSPAEIIDLPNNPQYQANQEYNASSEYKTDQ